MSSLSKVASFSPENIESPEESGWTMYFEDFFSNAQYSSIYSVANSSSSSLVSDAASGLPVKKVADNNSHEHNHEDFSASKKGGNRSSNFKKNRKKTKAANNLVHDDDDHVLLEDTASSPLINNFKEEGSKSPERKELDSDCTELKKNGLCLVPLSMSVDHLA